MQCAILIDERFYASVDIPVESLSIFYGYRDGYNMAYVDPATGNCWLRIIGNPAGAFQVDFVRRFHDISWSYFPDFTTPLPACIWQLIVLGIINTERYRNGKPPIAV